jgi:diaminopimelate epimerase
VVFSEGLDKIDVKSIGSLIRYHKRFMPKGTNANFVEVRGRDSVAIRTYERGVEDETLACGTGSVAAAIIFSLKSGFRGTVKVRTRSGEVLRVYSDQRGHKIKDVWLEGKAEIVYKGEYYV